MIVSHEHQFIFIKTAKTAGTSVEIALSRFCGPDDIITPIARKDEQKREALGYRGPQHHLAPFSDYALGDWAHLLRRRRRKLRFYNHIPAQEARAHLAPEVWDGYFKFCFERNPWDRVISMYYWRHKSEPRPTVSAFLDSDVPLLLKRRGFGLYTIDGEVVVDRICRFEDLADEMEAVRTHVGLPEPLELPRTKTKARKDKRNYRDILSEEDRAKIAALFREEIELLGYTF